MLKTAVLFLGSLMIGLLASIVPYIAVVGTMDNLSSLNYIQLAGSSCSIGEGIAILIGLLLIVYLPFSLGITYIVFKRLKQNKE